MSFPLNCYSVYVDSSNRASGTDSDFIYNIALPSDQEFTHVCLLNALIPKSYYLIQRGFNTFQLREGATIITVTVPIGNYILNAFRTTITTLLNNASPNGWVYSVTYPPSSGPDTGKFTYSVAGNSSQPSLIFGDVLYEPFGFLPSTVNTFISGSLESVTVIKLQSEDRLIIHTNLVNNPNQDNIIISINAANIVPFSSVQWINPDGAYRSHRLNGSNCSAASFSLSNERGIPLDLNGLNQNFTLMFFKQDNIFDVIRNFIKILSTPKNLQ